MGFGCRCVVTVLSWSIVVLCCVLFSVLCDVVCVGVCDVSGVAR